MKCHLSIELKYHIFHTLGAFNNILLKRHYFQNSGNPAGRHRRQSHAMYEKVQPCKWALRERDQRGITTYPNVKQEGTQILSDFFEVINIY